MLREAPREGEGQAVSGKPGKRHRSGCTPESGVVHPECWCQAGKPWYRGRPGQPKSDNVAMARVALEDARLRSADSRALRRLGVFMRRHAGCDLQATAENDGFVCVWHDEVTWRLPRAYRERTLKRHKRG